MEERYTITDIINCSYDNEYEFSDDRTTLTLVMWGTGDSIDYSNPHSFDGWEEYCMITQGFEPLENDEDTSELDDGATPMRTHSYKSICKEYTLTLPPNRKRGDTYTSQQIQEMVTDNEFLGDDIPGMGFSYYNIPDEQYEEDMYED